MYLPCTVVSTTVVTLRCVQWNTGTSCDVANELKSTYNVLCPYMVIQGLVHVTVTWCTDSVHFTTSWKVPVLFGELVDPLESERQSVE